MRESEERPPDRGATEPTANGADEFSIARSKALVPLLVMSGATVLAILLAIVRAKPIDLPEGAAATQAFGPADFPLVFEHDEPLAGLDRATAGDAQILYPVPAPPFSDGIFPCSACHAAVPPDPQRRPLEGMHSDIVFRHDEEHRWCLDCHDLNDRDQLRLASGTLVPFTESYRLCGQCHGTQYRDWRSGIHGKRTGYWNGPKRYLLCVHCHNPHQPHFASLEPLRPPVRPQFLAASSAAVRSKGPARTEPRDGD